MPLNARRLSLSLSVLLGFARAASAQSEAGAVDAAVSADATAEAAPQAPSAEPSSAAATTMDAGVAPADGSAPTPEANAAAQGADAGAQGSADASAATQAEGGAPRPGPPRGEARAVIEENVAARPANQVRTLAAATRPFVRFGLLGELQIRGVALTTQPLPTSPGRSTPGTLNQNLYLEDWFRFTPRLELGDTFRLVSQFDVARGLLAGDSTRQVELSRDARDTTLSAFPNGPFDLRWLYLDWTTPIGRFLVGQQGQYWGMGLLANDGNHRPLFGDYRTGDLLERVLFATRPGGRNSDFVAALAGDLVFRDRLARLVQSQVPVYTGDLTLGMNPRTIGGDWAWQGSLALFYQHHSCEAECERKRVGAFLVYRGQQSPDGTYLQVGAVDLAARWEWPTPDGLARVFASAELVGLFGRTNAGVTASGRDQTVAQFLGAVELGVERTERFRVALEAGYATGDGNPTDDTFRRATMHPDHRIGLLLFPEVLAWQTARSASIAADPALGARAPRGAQLLPSSGGVTGAAYLYPNALVNLGRYFDLRLAAVLAAATSDMVDPTQLILSGNARNYRGADPRPRDLGLEFDLGVGARVPIALGITFVGGVQGAVLFPGRAFDGAGLVCGTTGGTCSLGVQALGVARVGIEF